MLNSFEIAQLFAAQNQQFMQQNSFAQNIGIAPPPASLGGYGSMYGPPPFAPGVASSFSYAPTGFAGPSFGPGNKAAAFGMGALSAAPMAGGIGLGIASSFSPFRWMAPLVDPFAGAAAGFSRGGLMGAMGGAALPIGIGMAGGALAGAIMSPMIAGGSQQSMVNAGMGQFQFFNSGSRTGMGFNRSDASAMGEQIRSLSQIPEMMASMEELTRLLPKLRASGVGQGVREVHEFANRFKEALSTIRDMSRIFGTTLEDAEKFFSHSRSVGFLGKSDQLRNAVNAQLTSGLTGMNIGQVMQLQQAGANMSFAIGSNRGVGARAVTTLAQNIGLAQSNGLLAPGAVELATGLTGPEAIEALSMKMGGVAMQLGQTAVGRSMMAGLSSFNESGAFTGLDSDLVKKFNAGGVSISDLKSRGMNLSGAQKRSFMRRLPTIAAELAAQAGPGGLATMLTGALGGNEDNAAIMMQRLGLSDAESDIALSLRGVGAGREGNQMTTLRMKEALLRERTDPDAVIRRIKTKIHNVFSSPLEGAGAKMYNTIGKVYEDTLDDLIGRHVIALSEDTAKAFEQAMGSGNFSGMGNVLSAASGSPISAKGGIVSSIRDSEILAKITRGDLNTGRNSSSEATRMQRLLGPNSEQVRRALMSGSAFSGNISAAGSIMNRMQAGIPNFLMMEDARRSDATMEAISNLFSSTDLIGSDTYNVLRTGTVGQVRRAIGGNLLGSLNKSGSANARRAGSLISAGLSFKDDNTNFMLAVSRTGNATDTIWKINDEAIGDMSAAKQFNDVAFRDGRKKDALAALESSGLKGTTISLITGPNGQARLALMKALKDPDIQKIISQSDLTKVQKELESHGIRLDVASIKQLQMAYSDIFGKSSDGKILKALSDFSLASLAADHTVLSGNIAEAANSMSQAVNSMPGLDSDTRKLLGDTANVFSSFASDFTMGPEASSAAKKLAMAYRMGSKSRRQSILTAVGSDMAGVLASSDALVNGLSGTMNIRDVASKLGLDVGTLVANDFTGDITMNSDTRGRLAAIRDAAKIIGARKGDAAIAGSGDAALKKTLEDIDLSNKLQTTILVGLTGAMQKGISDSKKSEILDNTREDVRKLSGRKE
jgi:hypothetical protein